MASSEVILRRILGPIRSSIRPLVLAVDITRSLLFQLHIAMDDIKVTKHIYPSVAKLLGQSQSAVTKSIERLTHICWDSMAEQELTEFYIGRDLRQMPTPREFLTYMAVYSELETPFFHAIEEYPDILFQEPAGMQKVLITTEVYLNDNAPESLPAVGAITSGASSER